MLAGYVASRASVKSAAFAVVTGVGKPPAGCRVLVLLSAAWPWPVSRRPTALSARCCCSAAALRRERFWALLLIGVASIFTLIYTIRAFQRIWWQPPAEGITTKPAGDRLVAPTILVTLIVVLGLWAEPLVRVAQRNEPLVGRPGALYSAVLGG